MSGVASSALAREANAIPIPTLQVALNLTWRWSKQIPGPFLGREPWEIVACPNAETFDRMCRLYYPHFLLGGDRLGRPVLLQKVRETAAVPRPAHLTHSVDEA